LRRQDCPDSSDYLPLLPGYPLACRVYWPFVAVITSCLF
jgi:hypothetical protein